MDDVDELESARTEMTGELLPRELLSKDDVKAGQRQLVEGNPFIPATFNGKEWRKPLFASESFDTGLVFEGSENNYLTSADLYHLAQKYNQYALDDKERPRFYKRLETEISETWIRYLCQEKPKPNMNTLFLLVECNKNTVEKRTGVPVNILTIFHVDKETKRIYTPQGLLHSTEAYLDVAKDCKLGFSKFNAMRESDVTCITKFKNLAYKCKSNPIARLTDHEHFQVFCLFNLMRVSDTKHSVNMFELAGYATQLTRMKSENNFSVMGGSFNPVRILYLYFLFGSPEAVERDSDKFSQIKKIFEDAYQASFEHRSSRASKKRKRATGNDEESEDDDQDESWKDDLQYFNLGLDDIVVQRAEHMWREYIQAELTAKVPKNIEEYFALFNKNRDMLAVKQRDWEAKVQGIMATDKVSREVAEKDTFDLLATEFKITTNIRIRKREGQDHVEDPLARWAERYSGTAKEVMIKMILQALAMAANKTVPTHGSFTKEERESFFTRFIRPFNPNRRLAERSNDQVVTNVMLVEKAMNASINMVTRNWTFGKDIAVIIALRYKDMHKVVSETMEKHYVLLQKWLKDTILELPQSDEENSSDDMMEFGTYFLPSFLSAMVLYISRQMFALCEENKWFDWPVNVTTVQEVDRIMPTKPAKIKDLAIIETEYESIERFASTVSLIYNVEDLKDKIFDEDVMDRSILSRRRIIRISHINGSDCAPITIHVVKKVTAEGKFEFVIKRPKFPFSMYPIFSECDPTAVLFQHVGQIDALEKHSVLLFIHDWIQGRMKGFITNPPKVHDQIPVSQRFTYKSGSGDIEWRELLEAWKDLTPAENQGAMFKGYLSAINTVTMDIAVTTYLLISNAIMKPPVIQPFPEFGINTEALERTLRTAGATGAASALNHRLEQYFGEIGRRLKTIPDKMTERTIIGRSIIDNTLHGIVFVGSISTAFCMNDRAPAKCKHLGQIAPLDSTYFVDSSKKHRYQNMFSEAIILNPLIHEVENAEPMTRWGWETTKETLEASKRAAASGHAAGGASSR